MKKTKEVTQTVNESEILCDLCLLEGKEKKIGSEYSRYCHLCERDICEEHIVFDDRDHSDYPNKYCISCWEIGEKYRYKMEEIEEAADEKIEEVEKEWKKLALEKIEKNK